MAKDKAHSTPDEPVKEGHLPLTGAAEPFKPEEVTIGDLLGVLRRLTLKITAALLGAIVTFTSAVFLFGYLIALKQSGIVLNRPFDMRISVTEKDVAKNENGSVDYLLPKLILVDPIFAKSGDKKCYMIFREVAPLNDRKVGQVECLVVKASFRDIVRDYLVGLSNTILGDMALAQHFSLGAHLNDNNYTQSFVAVDTVRRTYADGCILQYKIDVNGISIPSSYTWIVYKH